MHPLLLRQLAQHFGSAGAAPAELSDFLKLVDQAYTKADEDRRLLQESLAERELAEEALRASERKFRSIFEESRDAIYISTPEGRLLDMNPAGVEFFGYDSKDELLTVDIASTLYARPEDRRRLLDELQQHGHVRDLELRVRTRGGAERVVIASATAEHDARGDIAAIRGILRDVTDKRLLQSQLLQAQRMEAMGRVAGGVAHDFNNLLTTILGYSDLLSSELSAADARQQELLEIKRAATRAADLTKQLLALSRRQVLTPRVLDLNAVISGMEQLLRRVAGPEVKLITDFEPSLEPVIADQGQLEQVILNMAVNARDAMPTGGRLLIRTRSVDVGRTGELRLPGLEAGRHVVLTISDTGVGIDAAIQERIFEPFFTTKESGTGTGLGLAAAYGIIHQSGGHIEVESRVGRGTAFHVYLPSASKAPEHASHSGQRRLSLRDERVLLVEDEPALRALITQFLEQEGYRVVACTDGFEALSRARSSSVDFDLLLTDLVMPGMSGLELAQELLDGRPGLKVLYMSGYAEQPEALSQPGDAKSESGFLQKPFATEVLADKVRELLEV